MAGKRTGQALPTGDKLDLTALRSYSPEWPHTLRLTLAIAVQYACQRCVDRAVEVHRLLYPGSSVERRGQDAYNAPYNVRVSTQAEATDDADLVQRDEDGNVQGQLQGWARTQQVRQDRELVEAWREYANKYLTATCQHLGIPIETLPPGPTTLEDVRSASRGLPVQEQDVQSAVETQFEMGTSHTLSKAVGAGVDAEDGAEEQEGNKPSGVKESEKAEKLDDDIDDLQKSLDDTTIDSAEKETQPPELVEEKVQRQGGVLDEEGASREIEVINDLLLIALGMGQHRADDGSTTLFEQEALFGDTDDLQVHDVPQSDANIETEAETEQTALGKSGAKAWGAFRSGVSSIGRASKNVAEKAKSKQGQQGPTKPNELCHYDARARAIIFVAVSAMDVHGMDVYLAEKVVAQTVYFIMTEARRASEKEGKGDPLKSGGVQDDEHDKQRGQWMNTASQEAVEREKSKKNWTRWAVMGAGAAVGGALIGVTGGLAAPLVAPALVGLTGIGFLATTGGVVMMATLLGVSGAGLAGYRVQRRLRGIDRFEFREVESVAGQAGMSIPSLTATICCSGLQLKDDRQGQAFDSAYHFTPDARNAYVIGAEEDMMKRAGEGLRGYVLDTVLKSGGQRIGTEVLKHTAMAGIAALTLPLTAWTAASAALDGVFVQAKSRAYRAGLILADVLRDEVQGHRPVVLIGTSLGCVTIFTALTELAKTPAETAHIIDSVFLIGAPFSPSPASLRRARSVVARRFVTAYSSRDMVCSIAAWLGSGVSIEELRAGKMPRIVGSGAVLDVPGVENVDVSDLVDSHFKLNEGETLDKILKRCRAKEE